MFNPKIGRTCENSLGLSLDMARGLCTGHEFRVE